MDRFKNRKHAGELLANELMFFWKKQDVIVPGLPRGGDLVNLDLAGKTIILVDDGVATGSTVRAPRRRTVSAGSNSSRF